MRDNGGQLYCFKGKLRPHGSTSSRLLHQHGYLIDDFEADVMTEWHQLNVASCKNLDDYNRKFWKALLPVTSYRFVPLTEQIEKYCCGLPKGLRKYCTKTKVTTLTQLIDARLRKKKGKERFFPKLSMRYYGSFKITERINDVSFRLRLPDTLKIHNAFHVSLLKPFRGDVPDDGVPDEQPEVEENEEILVPEQILAHKDTKTEGKVRRRPASTTAGASDFSQRFSAIWKDAPQHARKSYEEFLGAVAELLGGEVLSEELHEAASTVYKVLCTNLHDSLGLEDSQNHAPSFDVIRKKDQLFSMLGTFDDKSFEKVRLLTEKLHAFEIQQVGPLGAVGLGTETSAVEFGTDIDFKSPLSLASQGIDEEVEDYDWDYETGQPRELLYAQLSSQTAVPTNFGMEPAVVKFDLRWLKDLCDSIAITGMEFSGDELAMTVLQILDSESTGDEVAGELFDVFGDVDFEQIQRILQHRKDLVDSAHKGLERLKLERAGGGHQPRMPTYGTQVSVQTDLERQMEKLRRKEERRSHRRVSGNTAFGESEMESLLAVGGFAALVKASEGFLDSLIGQGDEMGTFSGASLPQGTSRKVYKGYEEVRVPAAPTAQMKPGERLVKIAELEEFAQTAFEGFETLNRIQSRIFQTAYYSNENILVCAPTGAGKTNIAMIAVLREIGQHLKYGILQKGEFKIVYVAPMKALAGEMTRAFSHRLSPLNVIVRELTGDMQLTKKELEETQMIITTPEKWDVITRKSSDMALAELVKLLIIDEVHLLNDDRGPVIEALVARTLRQVESTQSMIRIIGLSATLPNFNENMRMTLVADFI
ncbi:hypothetical protein L7F22_025062 [Adiantum nelumboides]|nr:hypothetical protein [Adiantum nelumboides]